MSSSNSLFSTTDTLGNLNVNSGLTVPLNKAPIVKLDVNFTAEVGNTYLVTKLDGCAVALPKAINNGDQIQLVMGAVSSNDHVITALEQISGYLLLVDQVDGTAGEAAPFAPVAGDIKCTFNTTTTGENGIVNLCVVNGSWSYSGKVQASGNIVTPFST